MSPGCLLIQNPRFIKGQSTLLVDDVSLHTTVAGHVERTNRLLTVRPFRNASYHGEVGDVVVGRISNVAQKKWKVDIYAKLDASLQLSAVNLPGGELRRRSIEDELMMREYLSEGDLISAEVQKVSTEDGLIHLHTRSLNYGKFGQKLIIKFKPYNIKISAYDYYSVTKFLKPE